MRIKTLLFILLVGMFSFMLSCVSTPQQSSPPIEAESLIGTKWIPIEQIPGFDFFLEFENERFCLWSFRGHELLLEYKISGNRIRLANNTSYIIDGDILKEERLFSAKPFLTKVQ